LSTRFRSATLISLELLLVTADIIDFQTLIRPMTQTALSNASRGDSCVVVEIAAEPAELRSRLYSLGIIPGCAMQILHFAPLGDPMQVKVGGSFISIRRSEADAITVELQ
jgi:ferrous iron transport protein A